MHDEKIVHSNPFTVSLSLARVRPFSPLPSIIVSVRGGGSVCEANGGRAPTEKDSVKIASHDTTGFRAEGCYGIFWPPQAYELDKKEPPKPGMLRTIQFKSGPERGVILADDGRPLQPGCRRLTYYEDVGISMHAAHASGTDFNDVDEMSQYMSGTRSRMKMDLVPTA